MSVADENLHVVTDHINELAARQHTAADKITGGNRAIGDVAGHVLSTHGVVCGLTSLALMPVDTGRKAAGAVLAKVSTELEEKLKTAEANYNDADYRAGHSLGTTCQV
jgi:hypothetical protein